MPYNLANDWVPRVRENDTLQEVDPIADFVGRFRTIIYLVRRLDWQWWLVSLAVGLVGGVIAYRTGSQRRNRVTKAVLRGMLASYVALVLSLTVFGRVWRAPHPVRVDVLATWAERLASKTARYELTANALMLLPVGVLLPAATGWGFAGSTLACLALTLTIEIAQLLLARGTPEASDVILNMLGATAGYGLFVAMRWMSGRFRKRCGWRHLG